MLIRCAALAALVQSAAAVKGGPFNKVNKNNELPQTPRFLGSGDNSGGSDGDDDDDDNDEEETSMDLSFLKKYNIMYENCYANDGTASFKLCSSSRECDHGNCSDGGEYVVDFDFFLDSFTELQLGAKEYACEMMREQCITDGWDMYSDDFDVCYQYQGSITGSDYSYCVGNDKENFQLQEYLSCTAVVASDGSATSYYTAPYCDSSDAFSIYMGLYSDADCSEEVDMSDEDVQSFLASESSLPFIGFMSGGAPVIEDECAKCREHGKSQDQNGGDDYDDDDKVIEQCEELYEKTTDRCESGGMQSDEHAIDQSGCSGIIQMKKSEAGFTARDSNSAGYWTVKKSRMPAIAGWTLLAVASLVAVVGVGYKMYEKSQTHDSIEVEHKTTPLV